MARKGKLDLRAFQQELAERLRQKSAAQVDSLRLGIECGGQHWLARLSDTGEVLPVPDILPVPRSKPWFLGVANIRGSLYGAIDFAAFLTGEASTPGIGHRLVLFGPRFPEMRAGLLVSRVLGLRNLGDFKPAAMPGQRDWDARGWLDAAGGEWRELDLARLAHDPAFLNIGL